jgi:hypothetical protein
MNDEIVVIDTIFGSHLYGTNDENSDMDYKRIVIPDKRDVILGRVFKSRHENTKSGDGKNTSDDTDVEIISLHYFFKLLCEGQTMALDILHAEPEDGKDTGIWMELRENREMFYTSKMSAFVGYALHQAAKYGCKGSRLHSARMFRECLSGGKTLGDCKVPYDEHTRRVSMLSYPEQPAVEVVGKIFAMNTKTEYIIPIIDKFINEYGERARMAEQNEGIDYKAVSHAFRACFEVREICKTWDLKFPLKDRGFLLDIKHGNITDWQKKLEVEIEKTKEALAKSGFPEKVDEERADQMLYTMLSNEYHDWY